MFRSMPTSAPSADFCFVHAADLHLDTPFKGISATAPTVGAALRDASLTAFDNLVELCLERQAAFLVIAGDLYDGPDRGLRAQLRLRDGLQRLSQAGVDTFVVHGNHDPVGEGWSAIDEWPARVHFFGHDEVTAISVERDGTVLATVQGISYRQREMTENLVLRFSGCSGGGLQIGLLHCNLAGAPDGHAAYSPCTLGDLRSVGLDYWALGHVHTRTVMLGEPSGPDPFVVYPGNLQARSPKPSERGPKGATVVEVRGGRVASLEAVACDAVRFQELEFDVADCPSPAALHEALLSQAVRELTSASGRSVILRARLCGRGTVHGDLARPEVLPALLEELRAGADSSADPFIWWDRITDATHAAIDLAELRSGEDFVADLLKAAESLGAGQDDGAPPVSAARLLDDATLDELLDRMPMELRARATSLLGGDVPIDVFVEDSVWLALDALEIAP
jgi:DNA repair exonuclease SbcCD nuclease subunit